MTRGIWTAQAADELEAWLRQHRQGTRLAPRWPAREFEAEVDAVGVRYLTGVGWAAGRPVTDRDLDVLDDVADAALLAWRRVGAPLHELMDFGALDGRERTG